MNLYDYYVEPKQLVWYGESRNNFELLRQSVDRKVRRIDMLYMLPVDVVIFEDKDFSDVLDDLLQISKIDCTGMDSYQRRKMWLYIKRWINAIQTKYNAMDIKPRRKAVDFVAQLKQNMEEALK